MFAGREREKVNVDGSWVLDFNYFPKPKPKGMNRRKKKNQKLPAN
jgi:hypothetical protein